MKIIIIEKHKLTRAVLLLFTEKSKQKQVIDLNKKKIGKHEHFFTEKTKRNL